LLEETFAGGRPTSTGNHISWDELFIRVKSAPVSRRAIAP
jgi:hypothetical protein